MTVIRPLAAFFTAMLSGFAENLLFWQHNQAAVVVDKRCPVDNCCDGIDCPDEIHKHHHTLFEKMVSGVQFGYKEVWGDIVVWFFIGVALAAAITALVPEDLLATLLGGGLSSMLVMLIVGIPLYICATASTPVAAALIMKGVSPGAALVFLLVGPATNITSLSVLTGILGKKSTILYLALIGICAVSFGLGLDALYQWLQVSPRAIIGSAAEVIPDGVKLAAVIVLLAISISPLMEAIRHKFSAKPVQTTFISPFPSIQANAGNKGQSVDKKASDHCHSCK